MDTRGEFTEVVDTKGEFTGNTRVEFTGEDEEYRDGEYRSKDMGNTGVRTWGIQE